MIEFFKIKKLEIIYKIKNYKIKNFILRLSFHP